MITADYYAQNLQITEGEYSFDIMHPNGIIQNVKSYYGGKHNIENAIGAIAIAINVGVQPADIVKALATFKGVKEDLKPTFVQIIFVY